MDTMDVTMPDGVVMRGVPVGTPKDQIMAKYKGTSAAPAPVSPSPAPSPKPPVAEMPQGKDISSVVGRIGKDSPLSIGVQATAAGANEGSELMGKAAGVATDVLGKGYQMAAEKFPKMEQAGQAIGSGVEKVKGGIQSAMASPLGQAGLEIAKKGALAYNEWADKNQEAARDLEAVVDIGKFIAGAKAGGEDAVKMPLKAAGELTAVTPIAKGLLTPSEEALSASTKQLYQKAHNTIEGAKKSGAALTSNLPEDMKGHVGNIEELSTAGDIANAPKTQATVEDMVKSISPKKIKTPEGEDAEAVGDLSIRNLLGFRQKFDALASQGGAEGIAARKASQAVEKAIDNAIKNDEIVTGDKKAVQNYKQFKDQWTKYRQHEELSSAIKEAGESSQTAKKSMQKLMDSDYFGTYPDEAKKFIRQAAKGKVSGNVLDAVGKLKKILGAKALWGLEGAGLYLHNPALIAAPIVASGAAAAGKQVTKGTIYDALKALEK